MSLAVGIATLNDARRTLATRWDEVRRVWGDAAADRFEADFVRPMDEDLKRALDGLHQIQSAAASAKRACS